MDKAVILARGLGMRMRRQDPQVTLTPQQEEVAATGVKALIPIERPFLDYVLAALADAGYRQICLVVGPEHEELRHYYGEALCCQRLALGFATQEKPLGTADAVAGAIAAAWQQATGRQEQTLRSILHCGPEAAAQLRQILAAHSGGPFTAAELRDRLDHFATENEEIIAPAGDALRGGNLEEFGRLVDRSQELAEELLGNQVPQTAALAHLARQCGAPAASAFGAGFGGSVWALVGQAGAGAFLGEWARAYAGAFPEEGGRAAFFLSQAGPAAFEVEGRGP